MDSRWPFGRGSEHGAGREPRAGARFVALFLLLLAGFELLFFSVLVDTAVFRWHLETIAWLASFPLRALGYGVRLEGALLLVGADAFEVVQECDATHPLALVTCAVLAYPGPRRWRTLAAGLLAIFAVNIVRVTTIIVAHAEAPGSVSFLHLTLWPMILLLLALAVFVRSVRPVPSGASHA
jgi:exosortase/archaeosortase family protein